MCFMYVFMYVLFRKKIIFYYYFSCKNPYFLISDLQNVKVVSKVKKKNQFFLAFLITKVLVVDTMPNENEMDNYHAH